MTLPARRRLIVALDFESLPTAIDLAGKLSGLVDMFKVGKQLFTACGPEAVKEVARLGFAIFLDLKFHDIPNTVAGAVRAGRNIPGVVFINVHTLGGPLMMRAAADALAEGGGAQSGQKLLGVTILTSMDEKQMEQVGISGEPLERAVRLAKLAQECGLDGVVASVQEARAIRKACGPDFLIVTPGVRHAAGRQDDQARVATPAEAIRAGADHIVVGRPITASPDPVEVTEQVLEEIERA